MKYIFIFAALCLTALPAKARPVSYPEGWTLMTMHDIDNNSLHLHYSPTARYSVGWRHEYLRDSKAHVDSAQINALLKRWNMPAAQANIYLKSGLGIAYDDGKAEPSAFTGLAMDWENRRFFTSYENRFFWANDIDQHAKHKTRIGMAPYEGDYGDIHTWFMLQADYDAGEKDNFSITPLIRFFKGAHLVEAGYNLDDGILFNYIHRF